VLDVMVQMHIKGLCPWTTFGNFRFPAPLPAWSGIASVYVVYCDVWSAPNSWRTRNQMQVFSV